MKVLLFIPCYRCSEQVKRVLQKMNYVPSEIAQVLIVDNQSPDDTAQVAAQAVLNLPAELRHRIVVVQNKQNYGLGGSFKLAIDYAVKNDFTHFLVFHGDDQADFQNACEMLEKMKNNPSLDAVLGSRFMKGAKRVNYSFMRLLGNIVFNFIFSIVLRKTIFDIGSGVNLYKIKALPLKEIALYPDHLAFDILILFHFSADKFKTCFHPTNWSEKDQMSNARNFHIALTILKMLWDFKSGKNLLNQTVDSERAFNRL